LTISRLFVDTLVESSGLHPQEGKQRDYDLVWPYFHNFEHDEDGLNHCTGPESNPYRITHSGEKHKINLPVARGHGRDKVPTWFKFTKKLDGGWELESGEKIDIEEANELLKSSKGIIKRALEGLDTT